MFRMRLSCIPDQTPSPPQAVALFSGTNEACSETVEFTFNDDKRAHVNDYGKKTFKYMPGEKVRLIKDGQNETFYVEGTTEDGKYTLCNEDDETVKGGEAFEEKDLESA